MELIGKKRIITIIVAGDYTIIGILMSLIILIKNEYQENKDIFFAGIFLTCLFGIPFLISIIQPKKCLFYDESKKMIKVKKFRKEYNILLSDIKQIYSHRYKLTSRLYIYTKDNKKISIGDVANVHKVADRLNVIKGPYKRVKYSKYK